MQHDRILFGLIQEQFRLRGKVLLSRENAAKAIRHFGEQVRSDYFAEPAPRLITVRPVRALEIVR
jgi:hypothetical protein